MPKPSDIELAESYKQMKQIRKKGCRVAVVSSQGRNTKARKERKLHAAQFELLRSKWGDV